MPDMIENGTDYVLTDEPAMNLKEENHLSPITRQWHRYQIIKVVRDDRIAEYREDLGASKNFTGGQIHILGGVIDPSTKRIYIEETVGSLRQYAEQLKTRPMIDIKELVKSNDIRIC